MFLIYMLLAKHKKSSVYTAFEWRKLSVLNCHENTVKTNKIKGPSNRLHIFYSILPWNMTWICCWQAWWDSALNHQFSNHTKGWLWLLSVWKKTLHEWTKQLSSRNSSKNHIKEHWHQIMPHQMAYIYHRESSNVLFKIDHVGLKMTIPAEQNNESQ